MTSVYSDTKLLFRIAIDLLAYLEYTHTFKLVKVKVNNPSLYHNCESDPAQTFVQPTFSFEAATLYFSNKLGQKWKRQYGWFSVTRFDYSGA